MCASTAKIEYPPAERREVFDEYHGEKVRDEYRWLEDFSDPQVKAWSEAQNRLARSILDGLPARPTLVRRLKELYTNISAIHYGLEYAGGILFALKLQPPKQQPFLVTYRSAFEPESEQVIVNPNELDPAGGTAIDFYAPSRDGRYVAVSLSEKGSEVGTLHVYETATGRELGDRIPKVNNPTAGGSVAWNGDGSGLYYTRYPRPGERPEEELDFYQQVYFHRLGTPESEDSYVIGKGFPAIAEIHLETSPDGAYHLATVANGDGGEYAHWLHGPEGEWALVSSFGDEVKHAWFGPDGTLYLLSHRGAPRGQVLRLRPEMPALAEAQMLVPESEAVIESVTPAAQRLYVVDLDGGPAQVRMFDLSGKDLGRLPIRPVSSVYEMVRLEGDEILVRNSSFTEPAAWYFYRPGMEQPERTGLFTTPPGDFSDIEVRREFAVSPDGTRVPLNILSRRGIQLDGSHPTILYGYGGYGLSLQPGFMVRRMAWLEQGGVYAIANLRGGGEYGEDWHRMGNLTRKQNVFTDFIACAGHLIARGYTTPERLGIEGGSNGGLLVGAALVQRPDLFRAAGAAVGIFDMLRVENDPNGAFNITEFGTVSDPEQFRALYAYSPLHHVVDGERYPAVLLQTGEHDGRVNPAQSRKMAARLQVASASGRPVLLYTSSRSGHGMGTSFDEQVEKDADLYAFFSDQLGLEIRGPAG